MNFFTRFISWIKKAKISYWETDNKELSDSVRPEGQKASDHSKDQEKIKGFKVDLPWPGEK